MLEIKYFTEEENPEIGLKKKSAINEAGDREGLFWLIGFREA